MKRLKVLVLAVALSTAPFAYAQVSAGGQTAGTAGLSAATGNGTASLTVDGHDTYNTNSESKYATSTAIAPALTSSNDTCMGSTSAGVQGMSVGVSIGSTWEDHNCRMLKNSREMWNMGMRGAAIKLLCQDADNRFALESTGVDCGQSKQAWQDGGEKVAIVQRPAPQVAQMKMPAPVVVMTTPQAQKVEQDAADIIRNDQARKTPQLASNTK